MKEKNLFGLLGSALGVIGTSLQTEDVLRIISLVITIIGGLITWIVIPILNWYNKSKADGKIDKQELDELNQIVDKASEKLQKQIEEKGENKDESKD